MPGSTVRPAGLVGPCLALPLALPLALAVASVAEAQRPLNLDFETASVADAARPWGWQLGWSAFAAGPAAEFARDTMQRVDGRWSLRVRADDSLAAAPLRSIALQLPAAFAQGRALRLTGMLMAPGPGGQAVVQLQAWGDRDVPASDSALSTATAGAGGFTPFTVDIRVPDDPRVHSVYLALGVRGRGTAWFDGLRLEVDEREVTALPTEEHPVAPDQLAWLASRSAPLGRATPDPGARDDDLALLGRIVGDAQVVGLGESTHGTREFFLVKHRILDYLVRRHAFAVFAIEANQLAVEALDAWVQGGPGTARQAMRALFSVWNTEEMLALVEWMRAHNARHPARPVRFVGYDMQDHRLPVDSLSAFMALAEPGYLPRLRALTTEYHAQPGFAASLAADSTRRRWWQLADTLWREVSGRHSARLAAAASWADTLRARWAVQNANLFRQAAWLNLTRFSPDRDSLMAANLDWALRTLYPRSRTVVWAHDVHVAHGGDSTRAFNRGAEMGAYLRRDLRYDYRAFSLLTRTGQYRAARSFTNHEMVAVAAHPAPAGSVEALLAGIPRPSGSIGLVTDVRVDPAHPVGGWLWSPRLIRHVGYAAYDFGFEMRAVLPLEFDGVVYIERSDAARGLPPTP